MNEQRALRRTDPAESPRVLGFLKSTGDLLVPGEQIEAWAIQRRLFALVRRRTFVLATTGRLLVFTRNLIAGYDMREVRWQDISRVHIRVGMVAATLTVGALDGGDLAAAERASREIVVAGLRKTQAQDVYRLCASHDQQWREKRRIRDLEEMRARAGGVQIGAGSAPGALPAGTGADALTERLMTARDMHAKGMISDTEYHAIKAKILSGI